MGGDAAAIQHLAFCRENAVVGCENAVVGEGLYRRSSVDWWISERDDYFGLRVTRWVLAVGG